MNLPAPPVFRPDDFPDVDPRLLELLTRGFRQLTNAMASIQPSTVLDARTFTTDASGEATVDVQNPLSGRPSDVKVAKINEAPGFGDGNVGAPYAFCWSMVGDTIRMTFASLGASKKYVLNVSVT